MMNREWEYEDKMGRLGENPTVLTVAAKGFVTIGNIITLPSLLLTMPIRVILTLTKRWVPGGVLFLLPFSLIWMGILAMLVGTSWLWDRAPFLRLVLIPIGVPLALIGVVMIRAIPDDPKDRWQKHAFADQWPLSVDLIRQWRKRQMQSNT
ncbi:hypothetical protein ACFLU2_01870 [Chloroflexota bacterium]